MRSRTSASLVLAILLMTNGSLAAELPPYPASTSHAPLAQNRLVVFEGFMRST